MVDLDVVFVEICLLSVEDAEGLHQWDAHVLSGAVSVHLLSLDGLVENDPHPHLTTLHRATEHFPLAECGPMFGLVALIGTDQGQQYRVDALVSSFANDITREGTREIIRVSCPTEWMKGLLTSTGT